MNKTHYNELIELSQEIYDQATDKLTNYCAAKYCGVGNDTTENQMEDYLFVAEETSAYFLGNGHGFAGSGFSGAGDSIFRGKPAAGDFLCAEEDGE